MDKTKYEEEQAKLPGSGNYEVSNQRTLLRRPCSTKYSESTRFGKEIWKHGHLIVGSQVMFDKDWARERERYLTSNKSKNRNVLLR